MASGYITDGNEYKLATEIQSFDGKEFPFGTHVKLRGQLTYKNDEFIFMVKKTEDISIIDKSLKSEFEMLNITKRLSLKRKSESFSESQPIQKVNSLLLWLKKKKLCKLNFII